MDPLGLILGDASVDEFFSIHWDLRPKVFPGCAGRFMELLSWEEFVGILDRHHVDFAARLRLVQDGRTLSPESFELPAQFSLPAGAARVSPARINELCAGGASIVLSGIRDYSCRLRGFAQQLELQLRAPVSVNAYYTPPGSRAFGVHYDPYDVFILQALGQKDWKLYGRTIPNPLVHEKGDFSKAPEHPEEERTLREGEALYVPRGYWHAASTSDVCGSLHLTVGVRSYTYLDLLYSLAEKLRDTDLARAKLRMSVDESGRIAPEESKIHSDLEELM
jgi:hypothetical protein